MEWGMIPGIGGLNMMRQKADEGGFPKQTITTEELISFTRVYAAPGSAQAGIRGVNGSITGDIYPGLVLEAAIVSFANVFDMQFSGDVAAIISATVAGAFLAGVAHDVDTVTYVTSNGYTSVILSGTPTEDLIHTIQLY